VGGGEVCERKSIAYIRGQGWLHCASVGKAIEMWQHIGLLSVFCLSEHSVCQTNQRLK